VSRDELAEIPSLLKNWKISFEVKPTSYIQSKPAYCLTLSPKVTGEDLTIYLHKFINGGGVYIEIGSYIKPIYVLPPINDWSTMA